MQGQPRPCWNKWLAGSDRNERIKVLSWTVYPRPLTVLLTVFWFFKIHKDVDNSRLMTDVNDTGRQCTASVNDTGGKLITGVVCQIVYTLYWTFDKEKTIFKCNLLPSKTKQNRLNIFFHLPPHENCDIFENYSIKFEMALMSYQELERKWLRKYLREKISWHCP